jgi:Xaa-Pro aminopeptidase
MTSSQISAPAAGVATDFNLPTQTDNGGFPEFRLWFGAAADDHHQGFDFERMRRERAARAREVMRRHGVSTMLVTGAENVRYLVGFSWSEFQSQASYALFFAEDEPVVFAHAGSYQQMPDQAPWISNWRIGRSWFSGVAGPAATREEAKLFAGEIHEELAKRGLTGERLAVVGFDRYAETALTDVDLEWFDGADLLLEASQVKTIDEIYCLKQVAAICSVGFETARREARPGMKQSELTKIVRCALTNTEADAVGAKVLSGPLAFERGLSGGDRILEAGDVFYLLTCGTSFQGYTACLYRTYSVGFEPAPAYERWYAELLERMNAMVGAVKPGASTADVAQHFPPASTWGYKDEAEVLSVELGHGIGLVNLSSRHVHYNWPVINRQWSLDHPQQLEPGMVLAIESLEGTHREGGVRLEDMVVVTESGVALLDLYPRDRILVAGA